MTTRKKGRSCKNVRVWGMKGRIKRSKREVGGPDGGGSKGFRVGGETARGKFTQVPYQKKGTTALKRRCVWGGDG